MRFLNACIRRCIPAGRRYLSGSQSGSLDLSFVSQSPNSDERDGKVALISIDDGKMNAFSFSLIDEFRDMIRDETVKSSRALIITGSERCFSAGFDLSVLGKGPSEEGAKMVREGAELCFEIASYPRPVIAAVQGHALALGAILLLAADLRFVSADPSGNKFKYGMNEVHIGMPLPGFAMELARWRLSKLTMSTTLGTVYNFREAQEAGYFDAVVENPGNLIDTALLAAENVGSISSPVLELTKQIERNDILDRARTALDLDCKRFGGS
eukprot:UC4_evm1s1072